MGKHPPIHVKAIAGLTAFVLANIAFRNIFRPGVPIPFVPGDDVFQSFFFDGAAELSTGQVRDRDISRQLFAVCCSVILFMLTCQGAQL